MVKRLAYTQSKSRKTWKRAPSLDNLPIAEWMAARLSAKIHGAKIKWKIKK